MKKTAKPKSAAEDPVLKNPAIWASVALQQEFSKNLHLTPVTSVFAQQGNARKKKHPTIAQKLGIAKPFDPELTPAEWQNVEQIAKKRNIYADPCPICYESFGMADQVILNCTHVFHRNCLRAFEKHAQVRVCPICRKEEYQKKITKEGTKVFLQQAATKIQSTYRGYLARKKYCIMLLDKNPEAKRKYYATRLSSLSDKLVSRMEAESKAIDKFLENMEKSLQIARLAFITPDDWKQIVHTAKQRNEPDCPICMCSLHDETRQCMVTSCSHVFHTKCLLSLEEYDAKHNCPVCRQHYQKRVLD